MIASLSIKKKSKTNVSTCTKAVFCIQIAKIVKILKKKTHAVWNGHKIYILQPIATIFEYVWNKNNVIYVK